MVNSNIKKCKLNNDIKIGFIPKEENIDKFNQSLKIFGKVIIFNTFNLDIYSSILNKKDDIKNYINYFRIIYR